MEPDYLLIPEIFVSSMTYTPGGLHTHEDCTPFYDRGVRGDIVPPRGPGGVQGPAGPRRGQRPRSQKWVVLVNGFGP